MSTCLYLFLDKMATLKQLSLNQVPISIVSQRFEGCNFSSESIFLVIFSLMSKTRYF